MKCLCGCGRVVKKGNTYIHGHHNKYASITIKDRIWKKINVKGENECWEWKGCKFPNGYGNIRYKKKCALTHRVIYELTYGNIPENLLVCHRCDNPSCCNPNHLFLGTCKDNLDDMRRKKRWKCSSRRNELNSHCKLTNIQVLEIKRLYETKLYSYKKLSKIYNVTYGHIGKIINNKFRTLIIEDDKMNNNTTLENVIK